MFCPKCGAENQEGAYNCHKCGRVLRTRIVSRDPKETTAAERMLMPVGRSGWAIAAGYAGLFGFLIAPAPIALVLGIVAIVDLKRNPEKHGWGRAIFGTLIGLLGTGLVIALFLIP
jgi:Domain of unknown function (DUF4190)/zinc-ribbon domain